MLKLTQRIKNMFSWDRNQDEEIWRNTLNAHDLFKGESEMGDLSEITYYTCLKILSESVSKLSIHLKDKENKKIVNHGGIDLLRTRPNPYMTPTDFKKLMEYNRNHHGNAYAYITNDSKGNITGLHPLNPKEVRIIIDDANIFKFDSKYVYEYNHNGKLHHFLDREILHIKGGLSENGIVGKSIREELASTIAGVKESQRYLNDLYRRGLTANAIIKYTGDLNKEKKKELVRTIQDFVKDDDSGNIVPLPLGMDLVPLDLKLTDAQFFELKKFTSLQIAAAFGVKPNHLNNYDKSSYANSEMQNLTFYIDTLLVILSAWEEEMNYKLLTESERKKGYFYQFNVSTILRGDIKSQAEALQKFVSGSIYQIDEARQYLGMPTLDNGEGKVIMVNGSYVKLEDIGKAYEGGETSDQSTEQEEQPDDSGDLRGDLER